LHGAWRRIKGIFTPAPCIAAGARAES